MHQFRPARIVEIEGRAAVLAEMPLGRADAARIACRPARMIDAHVLLALHLQGCGLAGKVDGVAAAARRLAPDRAVATPVRHPGAREHGKAYGTAVTGSFDLRPGRPRCPLANAKKT